jgi:hypothetical protein
MSTTSATDLMSYGMAAEQANALATEIDETDASTAGYPSADRLMGMGFPAPLAVELATQITAKTGNATNLRGLGVPPTLAEVIDAAIDAMN